MVAGYVIDNEALSAWSTFAYSVLTFAAILFALWQSIRARRDLNRQLEHQNWFEQKKVEERYLSEMLQAVGKPYLISQDFYFSMLRLLAPLPLNLPTPAGFDDEVRRMLDNFAEKVTDAERVIASFADIIGALRELHKNAGDAEGAAQFEALFMDVNMVMEAASALREWLADTNTVLSIHPDAFFDLPLVVKARETSNAAARNIARRIVRLYSATRLPSSGMLEPKTPESATSRRSG